MTVVAGCPLIIPSRETFLSLASLFRGSPAGGTIKRFAGNGKEAG
jgi:hypothetical protein